jgi:hypothetical protein
MNASGVPFKNLNAALFALTTLCWPIVYFAAYKYTTDTNYGNEDTVIVLIHVRHELGLGDKDVGDEMIEPVDADSVQAVDSTANHILSEVK